MDVLTKINDRKSQVASALEEMGFHRYQGMGKSNLLWEYKDDRTHLHFKFDSMMLEVSVRHGSSQVDHTYTTVGLPMLAEDVVLTIARLLVEYGK